MVVRCFTSVGYAFVNSVYLSNLSSLASGAAKTISVNEGALRGMRSSSRNESHTDGYSFHFLNYFIEVVC